MDIRGKIDKDIIHGFAASLLSKGFDSPKPTPDFHLELWDMCTSKASHLAIAAPRGHAKSTAVTFIYVLACLLFRVHDYVMIVSDSEGQSKEFLANIGAELAENADLINFFKVNGFERQTETNLICKMEDGHRFRVIAKGSEQKLRGLNWRGKRPNLIIGDDLENDEIVMNEDRREKFRNWFFGALLPSGSDYCKIRIVGTVLHLDSLLNRLLEDNEWKTKRYEAHNKTFSKILWPEKFPREELEKIRRMFVNQGFPEGYSQEYLNWPIDPDSAMFRKEDLRTASEDHLKLPGDHYIGIDLAISEKDRNAYTAMVVVKRIHSGEIIVVDAMRARMDSKQIIDNLFNLATKWSAMDIIIEAEKIDKALGPYINDEMIKRDKFLQIHKKVPTQDKVQRARPLQAIARSGFLYLDKKATWYADLENEMLTFPRGRYKDQVDALAWIGLTLNTISEGPTRDERDEDEWREEMETSMLFDSSDSFTGY